MVDKQTRYVAVDVETTGLSPFRGDRVIEIGAVAIEGNELKEEFHSRIDSGHRISRQAEKVHGITNKELEGAPKPDEVFPAFNQFIRDSVMVAHNARFDMEFLRQEYRRLGFELRSRSRCTLKLSRRLYPYLPNYKLDTVYHHLFGVADINIKRHRALDDARMAARIWLKMMENA